MSKQDGYSSRTATDLERRYNFGKTFAEVYNLISDAQRAAQEAQRAYDDLTQDEIFNLLTDFGKSQGVYRGEDDNVYINASYIKSGTIKAGLVEVEAAAITGSLTVGGGVLPDNLATTEDIEGVWTQFSVTMEGVNSTIQSYEETVDGYTGKVAEYKAAVDGYSASLQSYEKTVNGYSGQVAEYKAAVNGYSANLTKYSSDVSNYAVQVANYTAAVDGFEAAVADYAEGFSTTLKLDAKGVYIVDQDGETVEIDGSQIKAHSITANEIDADSIVASGLQGTYISLTDWDEEELGFIELRYYDRKETVNFHSNNVLWLQAEYEAYLMYGDFDEYLMVGSGGVYTSSGMVETSDRKKKKDITYGLESLDGFFDDLKPADYRFVDGTSGRRHRGFVAQDIKENLDKHGISTQDFAGYVERIDRNGEILAGLRYGEFIALLVEQVQKLKGRVAELEGKKHGQKA